MFTLYIHTAADSVVQPGVVGWQIEDVAMMRR